MNYPKTYFYKKPKAAIHCDTKQKWDIITREFGLTWDEADKWSTFKDDTAIIPETNQYSRKTWYEMNNFETIDFSLVELTGIPIKTSRPVTIKQTETVTSQTTTPTFSRAVSAPPPPIPKGDIIGVRVTRGFPNTENLTVGTEIFEHGLLSHKWKGINYYKQFLDFFEFIYGYKPIFFGGKEIKIKKFNNINCVIECEGKSDDYIHLKELRNAIKQINNFNFGGQKLEMMASSASSYGDYKLSLGKLKFGCTTGTIYELDEIISRCERILSE